MRTTEKKYAPTPISFKDEESLKRWLEQHHPQFDHTNGFKDLSNLWVEIANGESLLDIEGGEVIRTVRVSRVYVFYKRHDGQLLKLTELKQVKKNGTERERGFDFISEKQTADSSPNKAALIGLEQELHIHPDSSRLIELDTEVVQTQSSSYPGLTSRYITHAYKIQLTDSEFNENGYVEHGEEKTTYFSWVVA